MQLQLQHAETKRLHESVKLGKSWDAVGLLGDSMVLAKLCEGPMDHQHYQIVAGPGESVSISFSVWVMPMPMTATALCHHQGNDVLASRALRYLRRSTAHIDLQLDLSPMHELVILHPTLHLAVALAPLLLDSMCTLQCAAWLLWGLTCL